MNKFVTERLAPDINTSTDSEESGEKKEKTMMRVTDSRGNVYEVPEGEFIKFVEEMRSGDR